MDAGLLQQFRVQVIEQCRIIILEKRNIDCALALAQATPIGNDLIWVHLQSLLNAGANVSKAFWGQSKDGNSGRVAARKPLRDVFGIDADESSPFYNVQMRNKFDHFDEQLEAYWEANTDRIILDTNIGPKRDWDNVDPTHVLRYFDVDSWEVIFRGHRFDVLAIYEAALNLTPPYDEDDYVGPNPPAGWDKFIATMNRRP